MASASAELKLLSGAMLTANWSDAIGSPLSSSMFKLSVPSAVGSAPDTWYPGTTGNSSGNPSAVNRAARARPRMSAGTHADMNSYSGDRVARPSDQQQALRETSAGQERIAA
jgi:hypothetical protein